MRTPAVLIIAGLVAATLAACSPTAQNGDCVPSAAGPASNAVTVTGEFGTKPTVTFTAPLVAETTERTVAIAVEAGTTDDAYAGPGDEVTLDFTIFNGTSGEEVTATEYTEGNETTFTVDEEVYLPGLIKTIACSQVGNRLVGVIPPADAFGADGSTDLGIAGGESLVFVADIVSIEPAPPAPPTSATGVPQDPTAGFPTVELGEDGTPTITIPDGAPPAGLQIAVLKKGDGDVVAEGDTVTVQYMGMNWQTKTVFDASWGKNGPVSFTTSGVVSGFGQALVGQAVGSQVIVVIPPELGYGPSGGNPDAGIGATDTIVFVIDILATSTTG